MTVKILHSRNVSVFKLIGILVGRIYSSSNKISTIIRRKILQIDDLKFRSGRYLQPEARCTRTYIFYEIVFQSVMVEHKTSDYNGGASYVRIAFAARRGAPAIDRWDGGAANKTRKPV